MAAAGDDDIVPGQLFNLHNHRLGHGNVHEFRLRARHDDHNGNVLDIVCGDAE